MSKIIDRSGKGAALTAADNDANLSSLTGINESQTGTTYTVTIDDQNRTIELSNVGAVTVTMMAIATIAAALHTDDFKVTLLNIGAGTVTVNRGSTDTFNGGGTSITLVTGDIAVLQTDSTLGIWNILSPSKILGITNGTVTASKAVVVDANKDALGFGKITASASSGHTASFTATGLTGSDAALVGIASGVTGSGNIGVYGYSDGTASKSVHGLAVHTTGQSFGGYFEARSSAGFAVYAVTTAAGGIPLQAVAFDQADTNPTIIAIKGGRSVHLNPRESVAGHNPIIVAGDQTIIAAGAAGAIDTGVLTLAPYATDAVGIRIDSTDDTVQVSGTLQLNGTSVTSTAAELNILDGVTSTAAELNILDGVTASTAELNYNDITTLGTAQASKTVTTNASNDSAGMRNLTLTGNLFGLVVTAGATIIKRILGSYASVVSSASYQDLGIYLTDASSGPANIYTLNIGTAIASGTIRIYYTTNAITSTVNGRFVVNGTSVDSFINANGGVVSAYSDITVAAGDIICLQTYYVTIGTHTIYNVSVGASAQVLAII